MIRCEIEFDLVDDEAFDQMRSIYRIVSGDNLVGFSRGTKAAKQLPMYYLLPLQLTCSEARK